MSSDLLEDQGIHDAMWDYIDKPLCKRLIEEYVATLSYPDILSLVWYGDFKNREERLDERWIIWNLVAKKALTSYVRHKLYEKTKQTTLFCGMGGLMIYGFYHTFINPPNNVSPSTINSKIMDPNITQIF